MNCARWDLCGGRSVMGVSTAIASGSGTWLQRLGARRQVNNQECTDANGASSNRFMPSQ